LLFSGVYPSFNKRFTYLLVT